MVNSGGTGVGYMGFVGCRGQCSVWGLAMGVGIGIGCRVLGGWCVVGFSIGGCCGCMEIDK